MNVAARARPSRSRRRAASSHSTSRYDQQIAIVRGIIRAYEKFRHHVAFSLRAKAYIEDELTDHTVFVGKDDGLDGDRWSLEVWGAGIAFNDRVRLTWKTSEIRSWTSEFEHAISVADNRDFEERAVDEEEFVAEFAAMEAEIARHQKEIERIREQAADVIKGLPIPPSATVRAEPVFWEKPSTALGQRFPLLFK